VKGALDFLSGMPDAQITITDASGTRDQKQERAWADRGEAPLQRTSTMHAE